MDILDTLPLRQWDEKLDRSQQQNALHNLERDKILVFPELSFVLDELEKPLLSSDCSDGKSKNISYNVKNDSISGVHCDDVTHAKIKNMMSRFNRHSHQLISNLFPTYAPYLKIGRTSYRPVEIAGRKAKSVKKDDTRLHVDAFPSSPVQGQRILRVFSNINPHNQARVWHVGESFEHVARYFLPRISKQIINGKILKLLKITKSLRTPYDHMMLQIHDRMKSDTAYQQKVLHKRVEFPAGSTWIVQTDSVSHAALSGQFVLEQTFYLPVSAMENQGASPLRILERLTNTAAV